MAPFRISAQSTLPHWCLDTSPWLRCLKYTNLSQKQWRFFHSPIPSQRAVPSVTVTTFLSFFNAQLKCHLFFERLQSSQRVCPYLLGRPLTLVHPTITSSIILYSNCMFHMFACLLILGTHTSVCLMPKPDLPEKMLNKYLLNKWIG